MNFDKVKEALDATEAAMMLGGIEPRDCEVFENGLGALEYLRSFIAELEKPAEDYDVSEAASDIFSNADSWFIDYKKIKQIIQTYAESYHAKKCVHCQKIVYCELCGDPITVGVCENCVPEIFSNDRHFHSSDIVKFRKELNSDIDEIIKKEPEPPHA